MVVNLVTGALAGVLFAASFHVLSATLLGAVSAWLAVYCIVRLDFKKTSSFAAILLTGLIAYGGIFYHYIGALGVFSNLPVWAISIFFVVFVALSAALVSSFFFSGKLSHQF